MHAVCAHPGRLVSRARLVELGYGSAAIARWVAAGLLDVLLPGQFRVAGDARPPWQAVLGAWGYLTEHHPGSAVRLTGQAALKAAGIDVDLPSIPTFLVAHGRRVRLSDQPFSTIQRRDLQTWSGVTRMGMVLQPCHLAVVDLLYERSVTDAQLRNLLYEIINQTRTTPAAMVQGWQRFRPQQVSRLLTLVADGSLQHESPAERSTFLDLFTDHPPAPDCQVWMAPNIRVDFVYLFAALVLEYHGEDAHRDRVDEDATRAYSLAQLGVESLIITKSMTHDRGGLASHIHDRRRHREQLFLQGRLPRPPLPAQPDRLVPLRTLYPCA